MPSVDNMKKKTGLWRYWYVKTYICYISAACAVGLSLSFTCGLNSKSMPWTFSILLLQSWSESWWHGGFDNLESRFLLRHRHFLNASLLLPGTNGQEWLLILYCWIFNHPINLTCDKGSLATLGKNISACNLHHISPPSMEQENRRRGEKRGGERERGDGKREEEEEGEEGVFNLLIQFLPMPVTLPLCQGGQMEHAAQNTQTKSHFLLTSQSLSRISMSISHSISHSISRPLSLPLYHIFLPFRQPLADWRLLTACVKPQENKASEANFYLKELITCRLCVRWFWHKEPWSKPAKIVTVTLLINRICVQVTILTHMYKSGGESYSWPLPSLISFLNLRHDSERKELQISKVWTSE